MTQIDFYLLSPHQSIFTVACSLIEKSFDQSLPALVLFQDNEKLQKLSTLLWEKPKRLLFHDIYQEGYQEDAPILLATIPISEIQNYPLIINLSHELPHYWQNAKRILER